MKEEETCVDKLLTLVGLGQVDIVKELLDKTICNFDHRYKMVVLEAAQRNDVEMLKLLVGYGADLNVTDHRGRTVWGWAYHHKNTGCPELWTYLMSLSTKFDLHYRNNDDLKCQKKWLTESELQDQLEQLRAEKRMQMDLYERREKVIKQMLLNAAK